jgi:hypothetical protein
MNNTKKILHSVPFLSHFNNEEMDIFFSSGRIVTVRSGQLVDVKKTGSLNIVLNGIFEIESPGNRDVVYLSPGSFFGSMPFSEVKRKGNVKALVDSTLFLISEEEVFRFFLKSSKALRGYVKMLNRIGFDISETGKQYFNAKMKVVTVFSSANSSGKTFLASALGFSLSEYDKTVILDLSYSGRSVFEFFSERLTAPLSEKPENEGSARVLIGDRLVLVNDKLHLLNVSFSSRVKTDPVIIGYLLFILAKEYKYVIADLSNNDPDLRDELFKRSDIIFNIIDGKKTSREMYSVFDSSLKDGQRLYSVRNNRISGRGGDFYGGLILDYCEAYNDSADFEVLQEFASGESIRDFNNIIVKNTRSLVIQSLEKDSIFLSGFLYELVKNERHPDYLYSSSHSYFLTALSLLFDKENYREVVKRFFSKEQINRICDITFPEQYVFKNDKLLKYCDELAGSRRIEMFQSLPLCRLLDSRGNERVFSTGYMSRIIAAGFVSIPLFEPVPVNGENYNSGFPEVKVSCAHLFRTESDDITFLSVRNRGNLSVDNNVLELYSSWLNSRSFPDQELSGEEIFAGKNLVLEVSSNEFRFDKIFEETQIRAESLLTKF